MSTSPKTIAEVLTWARFQNESYKRRLFAEVDTKRTTPEHAANQRALSDAMVQCLEVLASCAEVDRAASSEARDVDQARNIVCNVSGQGMSSSFVVDAKEVLTNVERRREAVANFERRLIRAARSRTGPL